MKKILYVTNHEVPYRVEFFNQLSKKCILTVIYENKKNIVRNEKWSKSVEYNGQYKIIYLSEQSTPKKISFKVLKYIFREIR